MPKLQGAMGCYVAAYLAAGNTVKVGDTIDIPEIGSCEVLSNDSIQLAAAQVMKSNGVVLSSRASVLSADNHG